MIKNKLIIFCFFILITFSSCQTKDETAVEKVVPPIETISQIEPIINNTVISEMSQAFGFKIGQDYSLGLIEKKYPALKPQIQIANLKFDKSFGSSLSTIDSILSSKGNEWIKIKGQLRDKVKSSVNLGSYSFEQIQNFVSSVESRANGDIPNPIVGTLLTFNPNYLKNPTYEFTDGFKYRFSSKENAKAKGVDFHLDIPKSWLAKEGNRPNIVQKFISQNGHGSAMVLILVVELPQATIITEEDVKELAQSEESKDMLPKNSHFINSGFIKIDGLAGMCQEYKLLQTQLDNEILMHTISYSVYYKNKMISIQCSVGSNSSEEANTDDIFMKYKDLFKLITGSLVVQSQWQQ